MKVLVACEESQRVCTAFRELGLEAYSCDIQECSGGHPEWHIQQDVVPLLNGNCQFLTVGGGERDYQREMGLDNCVSALYLSDELRDKVAQLKNDAA